MLGKNTVIETHSSTLSPRELNSRRLTSTHLKQVAESLGLPTTGSSDEIRQLIEGKLQESRDVHNIQVVVDETPTYFIEIVADG